MALKYRDKVPWTRRAFKAIGVDGADAQANAELVVLSPDGRPDVINAPAGWLAWDDIPTEAVVGLSVALALLLIIMSGFFLLSYGFTYVRNT